ncbi:MAG: hypothetical protein ACE5E3_01440 [Mariprofundus sp.]
MLENIATSDLVLSALIALGMLQLAWFSVMILRRGAPPVTIQHAIPPLLTIWVLMWPVYVDTRWLWVGLAALVLPALLASILKGLFWSHLRLAWTAQITDPELKIYRSLPLLPLTHYMVALLFAGIWFQNIPEFGFGLALCLCLAFPAAYWIDHLALKKYNFLKLGFPAHPEQTLAGHLLIISICTALLCWSLHVYHGTDWKVLFIATLIAAMTASATRAIIPGQWNAPASMLSMGFVMWLL